MAISAARVSVTTTATALNVADADASSILIRNADSTLSVFLGGPGVTATTGYELKAGERERVDLLGHRAIATRSATQGQGERVYGIVAAGTATVHVLSTGVG